MVGISGRKGTNRMPKKIELGDVVKDKFTEFKGTVMSKIFYLIGNPQYGVLPLELTATGTPQNWIYFEEERLETTTDKKEVGLNV